MNDLQYIYKDEVLKGLVSDLEFEIETIIKNKNNLTKEEIINNLIALYSTIKSRK